MRQVLYVRQHFRAEHDPARDLVLLTRLSSVASADQVDEIFEPMLRALTPLAGLAFRRMCARLPPVQRRTETYGLVRRGWEHASAASDVAVTSLAWRA